MAGNSDTFHESDDVLTPLTKDMHRAIASLMEELEAVDWYQQRVEATADEELRAILAHNRDEEIEHAAMVLEWLRRRNVKFDEMLRTYLFTNGAIIGIEKESKGEVSEAGDKAVDPNNKSTSLGLTVGSLIPQKS